MWVDGLARVYRRKRLSGSTVASTTTFNDPDLDLCADAPLKLLKAVTKAVLPKVSVCRPSASVDPSADVQTNVSSVSTKLSTDEQENEALVCSSDSCLFTVPRNACFFSTIMLSTFIKS